MSEDPSVFVPAPEHRQRPRSDGSGMGWLSRRSWRSARSASWSPGPACTPRKLDAVERVADAYLNALTGDEPEVRIAVRDRRGAAGDSLGRQVSRRDRSRDRTDQGLVRAAGQVAQSGSKPSSTTTRRSAGSRPRTRWGRPPRRSTPCTRPRTTPRNRACTRRWQSGDPDDLFDAAEQYGKVFEKLAEGALAPKKILPTYKMLVESAKPPLPEDAKALALEVAGSMRTGTRCSSGRFRR